MTVSSAVIGAVASAGKARRMAASGCGRSSLEADDAALDCAMGRWSPDAGAAGLRATRQRPRYARQKPAPQFRIGGRCPAAAGRGFRLGPRPAGT
jgi:hypothetical protein